MGGTSSCGLPEPVNPSGVPEARRRERPGVDPALHVALALQLAQGGADDRVVRRAPEALGDPVGQLQRRRGAGAARDPANPKAHLLEAIGDAHEAADDAARTQLAFCQTPGFVAEYLLDHVLLAYDDAHFGPYNIGAERKPR